MVLVAAGVQVISRLVRMITTLDATETAVLIALMAARATHRACEAVSTVVIRVAVVFAIQVGCVHNGHGGTVLDVGD